MKKFILTIIITLCGIPVFAFNDLLIISEDPVKSVTVQNTEILDAKPVFTIDNEKKFIIITPQNTGKTKITVNLYGSEKTLDVKVTKDATVITPQEGFEYFIMDTPPLGIVIPLPPTGGDDG